MNNYDTQNQPIDTQTMPILQKEIISLSDSVQTCQPCTLSRGNFYALFSQKILKSEQAVRFDGMTGVFELKVTNQSYITIYSSGTYLISYGFTPAEGTSEGDFVGIKLNDNWITTSLHTLPGNGIGVNGTFLFDLQEGQTLHMAVQSAYPITLQAGNANANLCILQVISRTPF